MMQRRLSCLHDWCVVGHGDLFMVIGCVVV
jgi:hypothetical protein